MWDIKTLANSAGIDRSKFLRIVVVRFDETLRRQQA